MNALGVAISWSAVMALLYMTAYTLLMAVLRVDGTYAAFSVAFAGCALWISVRLVRDGAR